MYVFDVFGSIAIMSLGITLLRELGAYKSAFWIGLFLIITSILRLLTLTQLLSPTDGRIINGISAILFVSALLIEGLIRKK